MLKFFSGIKNKLENRYTQLLVCLLSIIILSPFLLHIESKLPLVSLLFLGIILMTLRTLGLRKPVFHMLSYLAVSVFLVELLFNFNFFNAHRSFVSVFILSAFAVFIFSSIVVMLNHLFKSEVVNADSVRGGICIYLLIGVFWALVYQLLLVFDPHAFVMSTGEISGRIRYLLFYYSFTSLTTMAYGDILPDNELSRILSAMEGVTGVLYITIFIAQLVGMHVTHKITVKKPETLEK